MSKLSRWTVLALCFFLPVAEAEDGSPLRVPNENTPSATVYDPAPDHLWNRLYDAIFLRIDAAGNAFGPDQLDVLLWTQGKHLLTDPSYGRAIRVLDEFIETDGEKLVPDLSKRAVLQRDLWAVFDWTVRMGNVGPDAAGGADTGEKLRRLRARLAAVCKRLALSREQIGALPDGYAAAVAAKIFAPAPDPANPDTPFLPPDLFEPDGPWVCLGNADAGPLAQQHVGGSDGRSAFFAFLRLPGGRAATAAYLDKIREFDRPWVPDPRPPETGRRRDPHPVMPNPGTPQFPARSIVALVRRTILIDDRSELVVSSLTEEVRLRVYRKIAPSRSLPARDDAQSFHEFVLNRHDFFTDPTRGLRPRGSDESDFTFGPQIGLSGKDPFDGAEPVKPYGTVMTTCVMCHNMPGVYSVNSIQNLFGYTASPKLRTLGVSSPTAEAEKARRFKEGYYFDRIKSLMETPPGNTR